MDAVKLYLIIHEIFFLRNIFASLFCYLGEFLANAPALQSEDTLQYWNLNMLLFKELKLFGNILNINILHERYNL